MALAKVAGLYRHPVKGFTPESLTEVELFTGQFFPNDRRFAVENGPSGYDPDAPVHISKQKFTVLARAAEVARLQTRFDDETEIFHVSLDGRTESFSLSQEDGRIAFAEFLGAAFGEQFPGPLKVLDGAEVHRFTDHHSGQVSLLNLKSVSALAEAMGEPVSADRFRMNISLSGMKAWQEDEWQPGDVLRLGEAELEVLKPTVRCKATHANPETGAYDLDLVPELFRHFERNTLGLYTLVKRGGRVALGDTLERIG